ncbi:hypothetical protein BIU90_13620 [Curtobacterium sp. MCBA15_001]|nr:hypothetical protein BIU90_13620 [Curtobacterium sp. MCBA15_001]
MLVGVVVAVVAAAGLVATGLAFGWPDLGSAVAVVALVLLALAVGVFGAALVPLRPRTVDGSRVYWSGMGMQAPDPIERYFRSGPAPTIAPADRAAVLREADVVRAGVVPEVYRAVLVSVVAVLAFSAVALLQVPGAWPVWVSLIVVVRVVSDVGRLGRVERARALAAALPDVPPQRTPGPVRPGRPGTPSGSKLALPGDDR